jgi:hypothetical protein
VAVEFESEAQKACYEKTAGFIRELFGEYAAIDEDTPRFAIRMGSALAQVAVFPWRDSDATIGIRAYVVRGAEPTAELMKFLLEKNHWMRFGAFGLDPEGDIFFEHTLPGSACSKESLRASMMAIMHTADEMDDEIVSRWGGKRAFD